MKYEDIERTCRSLFVEQRKRITAKTQETNTKARSNYLQN